MISLRTLYATAGLTLICLVFGMGVLGSFVLDAGPGGWHDGLGRALTEPPAVMRLIYGHDRLWAGWGWFVLDQLVFWGGLTAAVALLGARPKYSAALRAVTE